MRKKSTKLLSLVLSILLIIENSPVLANLPVPAAISIPIKISSEALLEKIKEIAERNELVWDNTQASADNTGVLQQSASLGETQGYTVEITLQVEEAGTSGIVLFWKGAQYGKIFRFMDGEIQDVMENKVYATSTSDGMHTYRFVVKEAQLQIFKDGVLLATDGLGSYQFSGFQEPVQIANSDARARIASFRYYTGDGVPPNPAQVAFSEELTITRSRVNTFDASGRLSESVETSSSTAEPSVQTTVTTNQLSYDEKNRQTGFTQTVSRQGLSSEGGLSLLDITETQVRSGVTYDSKNRVTSYHDELTNNVTPELARTVDRSNIVYTDRDEVASYNETLTEVYTGGNTYVTEQQVERTYDKFSQLKTEVVYERQATSDEQLISLTRRTKTDVVIDPLGVELHSVVREEDLTEAYLATDYNAALAQFGSVIASLNPTNPLATQYDNYNFVSDGNFLGDADGAYITEGGFITLNLDQAVDASKIILGFYNGANQRGAAYRVEVSADGVNFETVADQAITELVNPYSHEVNFTERSVKAIRFTVTHGINFGGGPLFYLSELQLLVSKANAVQNGVQGLSPEGTAPGIKSTIQDLDALGLNAKYQTTTRTTNKTNALGQIVEQTQIRNKTYEGVLIETVKVDRSNQVYNELGLVESYHEETTTIMTTWLSFERVDTNLTSSTPLSVNHFLYNYIGTKQDFDYNGHGHYVGLGSYAPTTWDIYQESDRTNITYNNKAQMTGYTESGISRPFGGNYSLTQSNRQYNAKGELIAFSESGTTEAAGSYNFTRDQIVYASSVIASPEGARQSPSTLISYHEAGVNPQDGPYDYTRENKSFDARGRVTEVVESGTKNSFAYNYHRTNIKYNVNELATSWHETGLLRGVVYDIDRKFTRYNNLGQETDHFEEGTRAGAHFFELVSRQSYDLLGRYFKSETISGETNYSVTYAGTRASTFYNLEGQVIGYSYYSGSTFVDVSNIQYDTNANIVGYTETTRGGATRVIFNIVYDKAGRIASQQFTDSSMELKFGNTNTQSFSYDEATGKLLEFKIENGDFIATFDGAGNRKSFELSAQMKAFIEEEQRKAVEEAKARARKQAAKKKNEREGWRLISRTEVIEKGSKGKTVTLASKLTDKAIQKLIKDDKFYKLLVKKVGEKKAGELLYKLSKGKAVAAILSTEAIRQSVSGKLIKEIAQTIKARAPNAKNAADIIAANTIRRVTEVYEYTDAKGNLHRITEIKRLDGNGNQIERQLIDRFSFRDERGKKVKAQIVSIFNADDRLVKVGESYKQKMKKGTAITKRTTVYDPETGDIVSQKTKNDFKKSGFFNSTFGKIIGIAAIVALTIISAGTLGPALAGLGGIFGASFAGVTVGAAIAAGIGAGLGQFALSLAQGASFKDALIAGAISFAAATGAAFLGPLVSSTLGKIPGIGTALNAVKTGLSNIGKSISSAFGATAATETVKQTFFQQFVSQFSLRAGSEVFSETFGRKLGVFGTVAALAVIGTLASSLLSSAVSAPLTAVQFGNNFANSIFSGILQGGVAEAVKNESGLGAQFLREFGSSFASRVQLSTIANAFIDSSNRQTLSVFDSKGVKAQNTVQNLVNDQGQLIANVSTIPGTEQVVITSKDGTQFTTQVGSNIFSSFLSQQDAASLRSLLSNSVSSAIVGPRELIPGLGIPQGNNIFLNPQSGHVDLEVHKIGDAQILSTSINGQRRLVDIVYGDTTLSGLLDRAYPGLTVDSIYNKGSLTNALVDRFLLDNVNRMAGFTMDDFILADRTVKTRLAQNILLSAGKADSLSTAQLQDFLRFTLDPTGFPQSQSLGSLLLINLITSSSDEAIKGLTNDFRSPAALRSLGQGGILRPIGRVGAVGFIAGIGSAFKNVIDINTDNRFTEMQKLTLTGVEILGTTGSLLMGTVGAAFGEAVAGPVGAIGLGTTLGSIGDSVKQNFLNSYLDHYRDRYFGIDKIGNN